jgi:hypothetical protein
MYPTYKLDTPFGIAVTLTFLTEKSVQITHEPDEWLTLVRQDGEKEAYTIERLTLYFNEQTLEWTPGASVPTKALYRQHSLYLNTLGPWRYASAKETARLTDFFKKAVLAWILKNPRYLADFYVAEAENWVEHCKQVEAAALRNLTIARETTAQACRHLDECKIRYLSNLRKVAGQ